MFRISIDIYVLIGILAISVILLIAMILIFIAYMYHDKRRFSSIDKYNEHIQNKCKSYNEVLKEYGENVEKSGVNHEKKTKSKFLQKIINIFKRGS